MSEQTEQDRRIEEVKIILEEKKRESHGKLTPENISNLTYSEIIDYNRYEWFKSII